MQPDTSSTVAFTDIGILVFREGLECILVLAAVTASMTGSDQTHPRPVAIGAAMAFVATPATSGRCTTKKLLLQVRRLCSIGARRFSLG
jgi:hypothetical protein